MRRAFGFLGLVLAVLAARYFWLDEEAPALDTERVEEALERVELSQPVDEQVPEASSSRSVVPGQADQPELGSLRVELVHAQHIR